MKKKVIYLLQLWDGVWSVPLAFAGFWIIGVILTGWFGAAAGTYDPGFIQPLLLAGAVVIGVTNLSVMGLYFSLRGIFRFLYGQKNNEGQRVNYSKIKWKALTPFQQFGIALFCLFFYMTLITIVYLKFV